MNRPYDLIVYGATGYLGSLVVQYMWANSPQILRWAVAGRSEKKLVALVNSLDKSQSHRELPQIMVATLSDNDLGRMASQTRLVLNTVGVSPSASALINRLTVGMHSHFVNTAHPSW
jgi:short subunit dehydrogenase-like uncharacterized protein